MITRKERAKQFMPFDAMKGLQEALRRQEEIYTRVEKHEVCEDQQAKLSDMLTKTQKGMVIWLSYYKSFHDVETQGRVSKIDHTYRYMYVGEEKISFNDIYDMRFVEMSI